MKMKLFSAIVIFIGIGSTVGSPIYSDAESASEVAVDPEITISVNPASLEIAEAFDRPQIILTTSHQVVAVGESLEILAMYHAGKGVVNWTKKVEWHISPLSRGARMLSPGIFFTSEAGDFTVWATISDPPMSSKPLSIQAWRAPPPPSNSVPSEESHPTH